jgi:DNA modification methylase
MACGRVAVKSGRRPRSPAPGAGIRARRRPARAAARPAPRFVPHLASITLVGLAVAVWSRRPLESQQMNELDARQPLGQMPAASLGPWPLLPPDRLFVTVDDAALLLTVTPRRIRAMIKNGLLPYRGSPRDPLIPVGNIEQLRKGPSAVEAVTTPQSDLLTRVIRDAPEATANTNHEAVATTSALEPDNIVVGSVLDILRRIPSEWAQAVVTSPPFWGQRVYDDETIVRWRDGSEVAFGREQTPEAYVAHTLEVLGELLRVIKPRGTVWWNIGDSYMTRTIMRTSSKDRIDHYGGKRTMWLGNPHRRISAGHEYLKDKDLALIPFHVASGAQRLGYWVRSMIIWSKQRAVDDWRDIKPAETEHGYSESRSARAHMPEIVADRPVTGHEYIILLAKEPRYDYYFEAFGNGGDATGLNVRSVWTFPPVATQGNHGARFPDELPRRCIQLSSKVGDLIIDPFAGQGTTLRIAKALGRRYFGCDVSPTYVAAAIAEVQHQSVGADYKHQEGRLGQLPLSSSDLDLAAP